MTSTATLPAGNPAAVRELGSADRGEAASTEILTSVLQQPGSGARDPYAVLAQLPVELEVSIPIRQFRVRRLLALEPGQVIETQWGHAEDLPMVAGDVQVAWCEFEVVEGGIAVRLTRLA